MSDRPTCAQCDRTLRRHAYRTEAWHAGTSDVALPDEAVVTKRRSPVLEQSGFVRYWLPEDGYGYNGQNLFCSLRCGYRWARLTIEGLRRIAVDEAPGTE